MSAGGQAPPASVPAPPSLPSWSALCPPGPPSLRDVGRTPAALLVLAGAGLLVAEVALDEDPRAAQPGLLRSLSRLLQPPGGERSLAKSRQLLQLHGFTDVQVACTGDVLTVVLATRPAT